MKKVLFAGLLATGLVGAGLVHARVPHDPAMRLDRMAQIMIHKLDLGEEQAAQLRAVVDDNRAALRGLGDQLHENRKAVHQLDPAAPDYLQRVDVLATESGRLASEMVRLRSSLRYQFSQLLSTEQQARMRELSQRMHERHRQRRMGPHS